MNEQTRSARSMALKLPERQDIAGMSVRDADLAVLHATSGDFLDTTHFDTVRFPPPDWAVDVFAKAARDGALAYTGYRGHPDVLASVAEVLSGFVGMPIDPDKHILLTPGTQAGLFSILSARVDPGDRVVVTDPDYLFTARILRFLDAEVRYVPLVEVNGKYVPNLDILEAEFSHPKAKHFVFSHPNNPTGAVYPPSTIAAMADLAQKYDVFVVADELYSRLVYDNVPFTHIAALPGMRERTATLLGPSKTESLSGYRLGVVVAPEGIMKGVEDILSITSLRAPAYAQHVLLPWLRDDKKWLSERLTDFKAIRESTVKRLSELEWLKVSPQDGTAYLWPDVSATGKSDLEIGKALMRNAGALISPGYQFGPTANGRIRICYARDEASWDDALTRIVDVLGKLRSS